MVALDREREELGGALDRALQRVLASGRFVLGEEVEAFESELARTLGRRHAVACGSGTDALLLALLEAEVGPGDEVLCPAFSFFATASSVARLGAKPVFVDIDPASYNIDPRDAERALAHCTRPVACIPVDLYGRIADDEALHALARSTGLALIEDAAQAIDARGRRGTGIGEDTRCATLSFYPTKNLAAYGDGGALVCDDADRAERLRRLRNHGDRGGFDHMALGMNSRLDALQAAVLRLKLGHLDRWGERRRANAHFYDEALGAAGAGFAGVPLADANLPLLRPRRPEAPARHAYHQYVVRVPEDRRDALRAHLDAAGIDTGLYYPRGLHQQPVFQGSGPARPLAECEAAARECLALPIHPQLRDEERERVAETLVSGLRD